jgi:hypothetical protein
VDKLTQERGESNIQVYIVPQKEIPSQVMAKGRGKLNWIVPVYCGLAFKTISPQKVAFETLKFA